MTGARKMKFEWGKREEREKKREKREEKREKGRGGGLSDVLIYRYKKYDIKIEN